MPIASGESAGASPARARRSGDGSTAKVSGDRHREVEGPGNRGQGCGGWSGFRPWMNPRKEMGIPET